MGKGLVLVGRFGAAHGVKGELRLKSFTQDPAAIGFYSPVSDAEGRRSFAIESLRHLKDDMFVVRIAGLKSRDAAEALTGVELYTERSRLPPPDEDEFYHADLIGLAAVGPAGEGLGEVINVVNYGAGDLLEIGRPAGPTLLVPFTRKNVPELDFGAGKIVVVPPSEVEGEPLAGRDEKD